MFKKNIPIFFVVLSCWLPAIAEDQDANNAPTSEQFISTDSSMQNSIVLDTANTILDSNDKTHPAITRAGRGVFTNVIVEDYLDVEGSLTVKGNSRVVGNEVIGGNLTITGTLISIGDQVVNGNETVNGNLNVTGSITAGTGLTVTSGGITSTGTTRFTSLGAGVMQTNSSGVVSSNNGTNGQVLIGGGTAPAWANITSTGGTATITNGPNTINIEVTGSSGFVSSLAADAGTAFASGGQITVAGGNNIHTTGDGLHTLTVNVAGTTNHAVQVGNGTGSLTSLAAGTNGQVLIGATGADPAFSTITSTGGTITFTPGAHTLNMETSGSTANSFVTGSGTATPVAGVLNVPNGSNINTTGAGNTLTINLVNSPSVSGSVTAGTGVTATTGNIAALAGNVTASGLMSAGTSVSAGTTVTAGTGVTATTGNITALAGNIVAIAGSAASPSIKFTGSTNTGFSAATANTLSFDTNGVEQMNISTTAITTVAKLILTNLYINQARQTVVPVNGGSVTVAATTSILLLNPAANVNPFNVTFPPSPTDGQYFTILLGQARNVTLTNTAGTGGATFINAATNLTSGAGGTTSFTYYYVSSANTWCRVV